MINKIVGQIKNTIDISGSFATQEIKILDRILDKKGPDSKLTQAVTTHNA